MISDISDVNRKGCAQANLGEEKMSEAELVLDCRNRHGEGVFWNAGDGRVWWTDIEGRMIWSYDPVLRNAESIPMADRVCCFAPRAISSPPHGSKPGTLRSHHRAVTLWAYTGSS